MKESGTLRTGKRNTWGVKGETGVKRKEEGGTISNTKCKGKRMRCKGRWERKK